MKTLETACRPKLTRLNAVLVPIVFVAVLFTAVSAVAQQINGTPGSPGAAMTIDGKQLPPPSLPRAAAGWTVFTYTGENVGIPAENAPGLLNRDYAITAEVTIPEGGAEGMIATMGGRFGGYGLYLLKGKPVFVYNLLDLERHRWEAGVGAGDWLGASLKPGKHTIEFKFEYDGPGIGRGGNGVLSVDGRMLAGGKLEHTIPFVMSLGESLDIGMDTGTPVDDSYVLPFRFTGRIDKLTYEIGPEQLSAEDREIMQQALADAND